MTFKQAYKELEEEFRQRVKEDKNSGIESIFLPNMEPNGRVDYVLVGMEPSLGSWGKDLDKARKKIDEGFRNFCGVWILHSTVRNYLCRNGETYYLTDLAKGAMLTTSSAAGNVKKYEDWYPLFEKEMELVAKPGTKIISIGTKVGLFLLGKGLYRHAGMIPHYSTRAVHDREKVIRGREDGFKKFSEGLNNFPIHPCIPGRECQPAHDPRKITLSEARKTLMFDYKLRFEQIRNQNWTG